MTWRGYTGSSHYPLGFYKQLKGSANLAPSAHFVTDAAAGTLPQLCMVWHDSPLDEHPRADVTLGQNAIWQAVDAVVNVGGWEETVFMLTWDDWGGYDDHVATPATEYTPDNVQLAYGPRIGLIMFGGQVRPGIDSRWCSHASIQDSDAAARPPRTRRAPPRQRRRPGRPRRPGPAHSPAATVRKAAAADASGSHARAEAVTAPPERETPTRRAGDPARRVDAAAPERRASPPATSPALFLMLGVGLVVTPLR